MQPWWTPTFKNIKNISDPQNFNSSVSVRCGYFRHHNSCKS